MTVSARVLLALTVAALALAGCGGGSSDTSSSGTLSSGTTSSKSSSSGAASTAGSSDTTGGSSANAPSAKDVTGGGSAAAGPQSASGAKQGPSVPIPKGEPEPGITPEQRREATVASMALESPSSHPSTAGPPALPAQYTCDGKNTSPALRWQGVPEGTAELALLAMNVQPVGGELFFDWAVAGLGPELEEIEAGKLPGGAVAGRNSFGKTGYGICPEGGGETYMFMLLALPKRLSPTQGFDPLAFRKAALEISGNAGLLALSYVRG